MFLSFKNLNKGVKISSFGHFLPDNIVDNQTLLKDTNLPINPQWIEKRVGVITRRKIDDNMTNSDMGVRAAELAINNSKINKNDIEIIILSTISPDNPSPSTACAVQEKLGIAQFRCPAFDISSACTGFIYALDIGIKNILVGVNNALIVSSEVRSRFINPSDPATYPIFGDGAGSVLLEPCEKGEGFISIKIMADGRGYNSVHIPAGGSTKPASIQTVTNNEHYIKMENGEKLFFEVVEGFVENIIGFLKKSELSLEDIDYIVPHQANLYILKEVARRLKISKEKMLINFQEVGNTSSASIPIVLSQFTENQTIKKGNIVLIVSVGAGHTMGLALFKV